MTQSDDRVARQNRKRITILLAVVIAATAAAASDPLHRFAGSIIAAAEPLIQRHAFLGAVVFVLLSALSAMVVFFSTAVIVPIAVEAFGPITTFLLLWLGWILGGVTAYAIGRLLGRRVARWFVDARQLRDYERRAKRLVTFGRVLMFQLAIPSEIPGYVLGLAGCRLRTFLPAVALGELPFAIGAVYLGETFLEGRYLLLFAIGIAGVALSWLAFRRAAAMWASDGQGK